MIYLDNNATTRPCPEAVDAVRRTLEQDWANPSSVHRAGQAARRAVELARLSVADLVGARARDIIFTSGATESIDLAIRGVLLARTASGARALSVVTTDIEHEAVRDLCRALSERPALVGADRIEVRKLPLDADGVVRADALPSLLDDSAALVSVQWANNETGAIQPIGAIGQACRARGIPFHCDGTQWVGRMTTDLGSTDPDAGALIDLLSFSAHKFHGPKGVGALYLRRGTSIAPLIHGVQELGRRGGTENVPGIAGMGAAAEAARAWLADPAPRTRLAALRDRFERSLLERLPDAAVNGPRDPARRLWNTTNIAFPRLEAEALLMLLSERGVAASAGAACSSGSLDPSPVLLAMGVPAPLAHGSLRFSFSRETTEQETDRAIEIVAQCVQKLRSSSAAALKR